MRIPDTSDFLYELERDAMNVGEHFRTFHPDRGQIVDVEKAAVVDFVRSDPPETQAIGLIVQKLSPVSRSCAGLPWCR